MKKIYAHLVSILAAATVVACGGSKDEPTPNPTPTPGESSNGDVEVNIATSTIETKAAVLEFTSSSTMNVFPKTFGRIDAPNIVDGVKATFDGTKWTMEPIVKINQSQKNAFVYAVAPYDASYTDAEKIPVDINKQVDLMYSGSYVPASLTSPNVKLTMKHALSLLSFNIVPVNFNGTGTLKSVKVSGDIFYTSGKMNASTGKITPEATGSVTASFNKNVDKGGWKSDIPGVWAIPFNTKAGTVNISFTIDNKTYDLVIPEVEMKTGYQYIFRLALTDNGLEFDPSKTETISLNVTSDETQEFLGFGRIFLKASGSWLYTPSFAGDAVFGTIASPTGNQPYAPAIEIEGLGSGQDVVIETWNSTGFTLETLDGIETIDLSQYE